VPATKPDLSQSVRLQIVAADLTNVLGRQLDGNDDGQPGCNYSTTINRSGTSADELSPARPFKRSTAVPTVIDALLARGELVGVTRSLRSLGRTKQSRS
jgi:hypothetical protein